MLFDLLHAELAPRQITVVLDRALHDVSLMFKDESVRVRRDYEANLPLIPLDEGLCEQAFVNLVQNAYDAMGSGGGILQVTAARAHNAGREGVEVRVEDTGPGIPADLREQIFNPFFTSKKDGVGLGLSIVAKIVDDHHGWIKLESENSHGARFHVFFPESPNE